MTRITTTTRLHCERGRAGVRGFVMVHARKDPGAIRAALTTGDFYASSGVFLEHIARTASALEVDVAARSPGVHRFVFIGKKETVLAQPQGRHSSFRLRDARGGYVRAVVTDSLGRKAWVQPVWLR